MAQIVISVGKRVCHGHVTNKRGQRVYYKGKKSHWEVYLLEDGLFKAKKVSLASIPYWRARIQRFLSYRCNDCMTRYRSNKPECPSCGEKGMRLKKRA